MTLKTTLNLAMGAVALALALPATPVLAQQKFMTIGTGASPASTTPPAARSAAWSTRTAPSTASAARRIHRRLGVQHQHHQGR